MSARTVVLLGSTGSIGTQALDVVAAAPGRFQVVGLAAGGSDLELLARQAVAHDVPVVAVAAGEQDDVAAAIRAAGGRRTEVLTGPGAAADLAGRGADVVLNGITGSVGLAPTLAALEAGSTLALANKESLVAGAALVRAAQQRADQIVPVDSEHSAIAQALRSGARSEVARLVLTASGGPFRGWSREQMAGVTPEQALAHPTWAMGPVVTTNSATLMNKGLELIEAHVLFDVPVADITVVVHPQSVVHSMVEFVDGSTIAQASPPDMRLPIALGLAWPDRVPGAASPCRWDAATSWTFEPVDDAAFPALDLAREAVKASPLHPAVLNAANEEAVAAFLDGRLPFLDVVGTVARVLGEYPDPPDGALSLEGVQAAEAWARARSRALVADGPSRER
ncbi:1-deoxy-D-xylulose 5-phosphate reductoisomerase [Beutenbergia cavernae DSM 12333]|uniref:1-deoxy-D-xylulose 5-phosphate reductoisomerase n=1 Tax=Beutenbergia cavernae (strain ATCC BAA-8 / DSM 12333 / CCUG 43141 / JCM 11478 / NBRC 16432 / NCIMB 13614 / HKI 0122) TaxID=471853 RepID=DXR_BEUC1|nr:1-deoxy-D-xylulose-5-phosphate reductoisomerase [Beutenbergia cavernae]C5BWT4.1 RecName: Full=1-deoxy-D-xylulose 5-phosphate reductoisomerase; Short=DXP reductoisomerase; AltName: Full=1-deoxyxylulose-5-phosphate reductoisomerase; AltName: Full=2-C-methyl-D-erythritol 4-phosphate synthase [Beutenbergia cavernae DSM 12333]ACQ80750.1 1-deoxy-D-xylulose 5-phosphate reductoisomerase [Beutenbergia cavernae DSM 12333]